MGVFLLSFAGVGARFFWLLELTTHFKLQYLVAACVLLPGVLLSRCRWLLGLLCLSIGLNAVAVVPWYLAGDSTSVQAPVASSPLRIALANVFYENQEYDRLLQWVNQHQPDVIVLEEFSPAWEDALTVWEQTFPYQLRESRPDAFGIALYSRIPLTQGHIHRFGNREIPWIEAELALGITPLTLWAIHPYPPVGAGAARERNALLAEVSQQIQNTLGLHLVVGDLNTSFWSPTYQDFVNRSALKNSRQGFGIQPTWPAAIPWLAIPLDQILVSPTVTVQDFEVGPSIGSDHLPVKTIVRIPALANTSNP
jgi:endonuclease/exonuclease/phosphatase (EEP) superfamily protein YafD